MNLWFVFVFFIANASFVWGCVGISVYAESNKQGDLIYGSLFIYLGLCGGVSSLNHMWS